MEAKDILELIRAGYTKADIDALGIALEKPEEPKPEEPKPEEPKPEEKKPEEKKPEESVVLWYRNTVPSLQTITIIGHSYLKKKTASMFILSTIATKPSVWEKRP